MAGCLNVCLSIYLPFVCISTLRAINSYSKHVVYLAASRAICEHQPLYHSSAQFNHPVINRKAIERYSESRTSLFTRNLQKRNTSPKLPSLLKRKENLFSFQFFIKLFLLFSTLIIFRKKSLSFLSQR